MKIQELPLESVSYTSLRSLCKYEGLKTSSLSLLQLPTYESLFSTCVIHMEKEKNLKYQTATLRINGRIRSA